MNVPGRFWEDGGIRGNRKSVSPPTQQSHWQNLSHVAILELWNLLTRLEGLQLPGEGLDGEFWSVSALTTVAATHSLSLAMWQAAVHVFLGQLAHSLQQPEWTKRTLSSKPGGSVL